MPTKKESAPEPTTTPTMSFTLAEAREAIEIEMLGREHIENALKGRKVDSDKLDENAGHNVVWRELERLAARYKELWHPDNHANKMLVLQGETGVAKTAIIRQYCQYGDLSPEQVKKAGKPFAEMRLQGSGGEEEESEMGAFNQASQTKDGESHNFTVPEYSFPTRKPDSISKRGTLFHDELLTKRPMQQNNLSLLITHGYKEGRWGHRIPEGWVHIGATNPPTKDYYCSTKLEKRLEDRCRIINVIPDPLEIIRYFSVSGLLPDSLYGFLMMNTSFLDGRVVGNPSPRTWQSVGHFLDQCDIKRLALGRSVEPSFIAKYLVSDLGSNLAAAYSQYLVRGEDPAAYPLLARHILESEEDEWKTYKKRIDQWFKKGETALLAATASDMERWLADRNMVVTEKGLDRTAEFTMAISRSLNLAQTVVDATAASNRDIHLVPRLQGSDIGRRLLEARDKDTAARKRRLNV